MARYHVQYLHPDARRRWGAGALAHSLEAAICAAKRLHREHRDPVTIRCETPTEIVDVARVSTDGLGRVWVDGLEPGLI